MKKIILLKKKTLACVKSGDYLSKIVKNYPSFLKYRMDRKRLWVAKFSNKRKRWVFKLINLFILIHQNKIKYFKICKFLIDLFIFNILSDFVIEQQDKENNFH